MDETCDSLRAVLPIVANVLDHAVGNNEFRISRDDGIRSDMNAIK
jgi:hypothetical protein